MKIKLYLLWIKFFNRKLYKKVKYIMSLQMELIRMSRYSEYTRKRRHHGLFLIKDLCVILNTKLIISDRLLVKYIDENFTNSSDYFSEKTGDDYSWEIY